jgi:transporter family-2 protein
MRYAMAATAVFNGILIALSAILNARLSESIGPLKASLRNHLIGAALISIILLTTTASFECLQKLNGVPIQSYLGGIISAAFVAIYSGILPRIGVMRTLLLIISGQMVMTTLLDLESRSHLLLGFQIFGIVLILAGVVILHRR